VEGSLVGDDTVAVLDTDDPAKPEGRIIVVVITFDAPGAMVPSAQGYVVAHPPVLPPKISPAGVTSATLTAVASDGPLLVTVTV
jgi:hypothetical protein